MHIWALAALCLLARLSIPVLIFPLFPRSHARVLPTARCGCSKCMSLNDFSGSGSILGIMLGHNPLVSVAAPLPICDPCKSSLLKILLLLQAGTTKLPESQDITRIERIGETMQVLEYMLVHAACRVGMRFGASSVE